MNFFKTYLLPGIIFQSVVIGGGYATGRELVQFFFDSGPIGGVLGLLVAGGVFAVVMAIAFEFARITQAYDYRKFCDQLLGRGWIVFEVAYMIQLLLVLSVIGSASGELMASSLGVPPIAGTLLLMALIGILTFNGSETIKRVLAFWSILLYGVYVLLFVLVFNNFGDQIGQTYSDVSLGSDWLSNGILYSGYNLAVIPAVLFAITLHKSRRETFGAGLFAGLIAVVPALLFFVAMMAQYPEIGEQPLPATFLMQTLNMPWLQIIFQIVVFGTFVETGAAMLHAVNERLAASYSHKQPNKQLPNWMRMVAALSFLVVAIFAAQAIGIVDLIAKGYGLLTLVFIAILVIPLLTIGIWKISRWQATSQQQTETHITQTVID